jgi:hypothetical protein
VILYLAFAQSLPPIECPHTCLLLLPPSLHLGHEDLLGIVNDLFANHDYCQLLSQLNQAPPCTALNREEL